MRAKAFTSIAANNSYVWTALLVCGFVGAISAFPLSYFSGANCIIGICLLPFAFFKNGAARFNYFYLGGLVVFGTLSVFFHMRVFYFLALSSYALLVVELFLGRIDSLILFLLLLMCPIFSQVAGILGFPIRLHLSQFSGSILQVAGLDVRVEGNTMTLNGVDFAVDEACMGLNMMVISLLMGIFVIVYLYRATGLRLSIRLLVSYFVTVFVLNIFSNVMRIVFLVAFGILPDNMWHEVIGILCLVAYVMIPLYFLASLIIKHFGKVPRTEKTEWRIASSHKVVCASLGLIIMGVGFTINSGRADAYTETGNVHLVGMNPEYIGNGITKFDSEETLIYVKSIPQFFTSEHTPIFCWKGSGFQLKKVGVTKSAGREVYTGVLEKGDERLYTSWWYFNGSIHTIDQFTWRSVMLKGGKGFSLINITAANESKLHDAIEQVLGKKLLTLNKK